MSSAPEIEGISELDIVEYLINTPGFFERNAEVLASIRLTSPHGHRAVSLQERQMEMLRERIKGLERKLMEMIRSGQDNMGIADRLHRWTRSVLLTVVPAELPGVVVDELKMEFLVPQVAVRLWGVEERFADEPFARAVSEDVQSFARSLAVPYCGINSGFEAVQWLDDPATVASVALVPLRVHDGDPAFGLLILASPDATRFSADMGTEFLSRIGELTGAALARLLSAP